VAIDVNSGRYVGKKGAGASLEDTITQEINCEAAKEIVYQLRLRKHRRHHHHRLHRHGQGANREKVFKTLQEALGGRPREDQRPQISDIGLVEMTRKRVRESITRLNHRESAPPATAAATCAARPPWAYDIMREVQRAAGKHREDQLVISLPPPRWRSSCRARSARRCAS